MPNKKVVLKIFLEVLIFLILFTCFVFFFLKDQMAAFVKGRTTTTRRVENAAEVEFPTIIICFDPPTKSSVAQKYGFQSHNEKYSVDFPNKSLSDVFDENTFGYNQDYLIFNQHYDGTQDTKIKTGLVDIDEYYTSKKLPFLVEPIRTYHSGKCTKLQPRFVMSEAPTRIRLSIQINETNIVEEDKPEKILFIFASNVTWMGILDNIWPQFKPLKLKVDFRKEYTRLYLQPVEEYFQTGQDNPSECLQKMLQNQNCSTSCSVTSIPHVPPCKNVSEYKCVWSGIWSNIQVYHQCLMSKKAMTYILNDRIENGYHKVKNDSRTDVWIGMGSMKKVITEEVFVLTLQDLIGSVGGSLGLFFGFSFSAMIFSCLNKFFQ